MHKPVCGCQESSAHLVIVDTEGELWCHQTCPHSEACCAEITVWLSKTVQVIKWDDELVQRAWRGEEV